MLKEAEMDDFLKRVFMTMVLMGLLGLAKIIVWPPGSFSRKM